MEQHIGIIGVGHRAGALFALDAATHLRHRCAAPDWCDVVIILAEIAHGFGTNAAAPKVAIRRNMRARPPGIARDYLVVLV